MLINLLCQWQIKFHTRNQLNVVPGNMIYLNPKKTPQTQNKAAYLTVVDELP